MNIGEKVREKRIEADIVQTTLAEMVDVAPSMICQIERGTKTPTLPLAKQIADALGCNIQDFLD